MDFSRVKKAYFIGVKGVGMTMLAQFMAGKGVEISGSDTDDKFMTDEVLDSAGIKVIEHFAVENIPKDADLIVYSTAYNITNNVEVAEAVRSRTRSLTFAEALAEIFNVHYGVAVCGSHGKTTTTAWLGFLLSRAGQEPNVMVGSRVPQFAGASLVGNSDLLVIEADEYQNKLRYFQPRVVLLNNIDYDHPDFFPTEDDYIKVFAEFAKKLSPKGLLVTNFDDDKIRKYIIPLTRAKVVTYGLKEGADLVGYDMRVSNGRQYFKVRMKSEDEELVADKANNLLLQQETHELGDFSIALPGRHNVSNALGVIAASLELGVTLLDIRRHLGEFLGTARRLELLGEFRGVKIYDDYAHHPTEVRATLGAVRQLYPKEKVIVVFHPHTYTRTKALLDQFAESFALADELIVLDIYGSAREQQGGVHSQDLVAKIEALRPKGYAPTEVRYISTQNECEKYLRNTLRKGQIVVLVGAGDVFRIGQALINK
jgi:UDP-N-acetylmuramate--alanine ligase